MAADGVNRIRVHLVESDNLHEVCIELPYNEAGEVLTVTDMARTFEKVTKIPTSNMRIIHNEKLIEEDKRSLKDLGITDGTSIHLIKRKLRLEEETGFDRDMDRVEARITETNKLLTDLIQMSDGIHRGKLSRDYHTKSFNQLRARIVLLTNQLKAEQNGLDVLDLQYCYCEIKDRRHSLTRLISTLLYRIEGLDLGFRDVMARVDEQHGMQLASCFGHYGQ